MRKSKEFEISSELFRQLAEHSTSITEDLIFQNVRTENGQVTYRVIVFDDAKFEEVMDYADASSQFVPLNFEVHEGKRSPIKAFKDLKVTFMKPLRYYGIYGISYMYRMVTEDGHLLFWITEKDLGVTDGSQHIINARVKKSIEYHKGGVVNHIFYVKIKE